ncbi:nucleotidyltransferase domain-containing protein [Paraglaciecola sp. L1A13]|uniref:nucleotidyltransferase domain-containing protein n=1 Tax=Paraglaciecola sp. L1A13 TaxID=2686359 RepID=UPI00131D99B0|nr:nucleotidyltransferase domain-containing protein [Paraglaciecola sp. L1A13]
MNDSCERYVFGSLVSGDFDSGSDVDVLIIRSNDGLSSFPPDWSVYTKERIEELYRKGTLFAWHLYLDAIPVSASAVSNDCLRKIGQPSDYVNAYSEISALSKLLKSSIAEIINNSPSKIYELGIVALTLRDIGMSASKALTGNFNFSKFAPLMLGEFSAPISETYYKSLIECRRATIRGHKTKFTDELLTELFQVEKKLLAWANNIKDKVYGYQNE